MQCDSHLASAHPHRPKQHVCQRSRNWPTDRAHGDVERRRSSALWRQHDLSTGVRGFDWLQRHAVWLCECTELQ
jgi:hypothetical protein